MYAENPGPGRHHCHCKYTAKPVQLEDLDITLAALILTNCCSLAPYEQQTIDLLRVLKNNYLSHNTTGGIKQAEYTTLWGDLTNYILQLDNTKYDDMVRIENRPLDAALCDRYVIQLLDIHERLYAVILQLCI